MNSLQTQSELDEQKGMENLLRGLYTGIRNPRTHEHVEDELSLALTVILFIDRIAGKIKTAEDTFDVAEFLRALPQIPRDDENRTAIVDGLAYALLVNQALRLQESFSK